MKKTTIFSSALVALAMLASCQKEQPIETPATTTGVTEFTATIETPTKTVVDTDGKVTWEKDDEITVTDAESKSAVYVATSSGASTTFTLKEGLTAVGAGPYTATYGDINKQKYKANAAGANCPLSAETKDASSKTLHFSSPYAVVKLTAKSSSEETVKTVVVKYGNSSSILDCSEGVKLTSGGVDFYVAVRPATNAALSVSFYTADKMATKTRTEPISLAAKDLLPVTLDSFDWSPQKTFKAVYNSTSKALTFYYDADNHSGDGTVYEDGTAKWLLDKSKTDNTRWGYDGIRTDINSVVIDESVEDYPFLTSTAYMFFNMTKAESISGAEYLDVSKVTDMTSMFNSFGKESQTLTDVPDVSEWKTDNVKKMGNLFSFYGQNSKSLTAPPDVSKWNTGNVTIMTSMFSGYGKSSTKLTDVPVVSGWKTDNVTNMGTLFANYGDANKDNINCVLDLTGWNLAKLTSGSNVFNNFKPKTFVVTIPAKTGKNANQPDKWYGSGTYSFAPPAYKYFIPVLTGVFTVSDEKKVHFSNSNLVAAIDDYGAPTAWKFAANQYGYLEKGGANQTIGNTSTKGAAGDVDLFGWSTDAALNNWGIHTKTSSDDDIASYTSGTFNDWGSQMGDGNTWRTLSKDEWQYLFNTRTVNGGTGEGNSYQGAYINSTGEANSGVYGVILYPDNYTSQTGAASYTSAEWATMEAAGCVFLPAAKGREGSSVNISGGQYWSSSEYGSSGGGAYYVCFGSGDVKPGNSGDRCHGLSVRLITECQ